MHQDEQKTQFAFEGRFLGFAMKDGKLKYVHIETLTGKYLIKMPKDQRQMLYRQLIPGDWLQVSGDRKQEGRETKWRANVISRTAGATTLPTSASLRTRSEVSAPRASACILVCQKSDCCKKGARQIAAALESAIDDRGLEVTVKGTGCMKRCKAGPNIVMPDKTRYTQIRADEVPNLIDQHFPESAPVEAIESAVAQRMAISV